MSEKAVILIASFGFGMLTNHLVIVPAFLLVLCNLIDYITALISVKMQGKKWDSNTGIKGIFKKVLMWLLVCVGIIFDALLQYACEIVDVKPPFTFLVASITAIWLICNELISILENIKTCNVKLPPFLEPLIKTTQEQVEEKAKVKEKK